MGSCRASGASVEFEFYSRWDGIPLGVCCGVDVGSRLEAGVKSGRERKEVWTGEVGGCRGQGGLDLKHHLEINWRSIGDQLEINLEINQIISDWDMEINKGRP